MAYCVECGVELAPSEKACPLCGTPVSHPSVPWREPDSYPYPKNVEELSRRVNIRYGAHLATILLLIPIAVTLLVDLMEDGQMTWSSYVLGAGLCLFCIVLLPFYVKQAKPYLFLLIDILAVGLYLLLIGWRTGGMDWVLPLGLPLVAVSGLGTMLEVYLARRRGKALINLLSDITLIGAVQLMMTEMLIDRFLMGRAHLTWSLYALVPLVALALIFRVVEKKKALKESILKRLFL
ncbi:MAG: zinc ribbon domain-containing protein [Clostridia bacterium]